MNSFILPGLLTTDTVNNVNIKLLALLPKISTDIVQTRINSFIEYYENSSDGDCKIAVEKLKEVFAEDKATREYLQSDYARTLANELISLQYSDISISTDKETLIRYRDRIDELFNDKRNVQYMPVLDAENYETVLKEMESLCGKLASQADSDELNANSVFCTMIRNNRSIFCNKGVNAEQTVLYKALRQEKKLMNIRKCIENILPKVGANGIKDNWRVL